MVESFHTRYKQVRRQNAENIIEQYLKPIFGFALKRCKSVQDAEDLSQDIVLRAFRALLAKDDIDDTGKFIWTVAHNALNNYYRDTARAVIGVPLDEVADLVPDPDATVEADDTAQTLCRLQQEIAYLSRLQRRIVVAYYFEKRKQAEIAKELNIPVGTVKWHLFEAKKELKRGMDTVRKTSELKFNPIKFSAIGINGSIGSKNLDEFFRSSLSQNICYCVRNEAKTVNEIADALGVSPVYVEGEVDFLEEYGFLAKKNDRYIVNFIISEPSAALLTMQDAMYKKAAALYADELCDALINSGLLEHPDLWCGQTDGEITLRDCPKADRNFLLWALIPYVAARSSEGLIKETISFDEVATIRPDGAHNICNATVVPEHMELPEDYVTMKNFCGPGIFRANGPEELWCVDTEWSGRRMAVSKSGTNEMLRALELFHNELNGETGVLSEDEYAWLCEQGFIKMYNDGGHLKTAWQPVTIATSELRDKLLAVGEAVKAKHIEQIEAIKAPYVQAVLASVPAHLRRIKEYELQFTFHSDGWFLLHCIVALLKSGKLLPPTEGQKKMLTTLIVANR
jgi:RNA polymerase sigma factor (sigma-70 family)